MNEVFKTATQTLESSVITVPTSKMSTKDTKDTLMRIINDSGEVNLLLLSDEEKEKYRKLGSSLVTNDINSISNYGADLRNAMQRQSSSFLSAVRASQCGEIGEHINNLLSELSYIDTDEIEKINSQSSFTKFLRKVPIIKHFVTNIEKVLRKYDSIEHNVQEIAKKINATGQKALNDNNALQYMFEQNMQYGKYIEELLIAGKLKFSEVSAKLAEMEAHPEMYEPYEIQDAQQFVHNLDKRLNDMIVLRYVIKQSLPQIRAVQCNNIAIKNKAESIVTTTIPVWINQLSLAKAIKDQGEIIQLQRRVHDVTETILKNNSKYLHDNTVMVAKENERGIVSVETLRETTQSLINTIREVKQIHEEGMNQRRAAELEIKKIEEELDNAMSSAASSASSNPYSSFHLGLPK